MAVAYLLEITQHKLVILCWAVRFAMIIKHLWEYDYGQLTMK